MVPIRSKNNLTRIDMAARILLGAIFIYAAWGKILHPAEFAQAIANYQILPLKWINPAALYMPWLELICGLSLTSGLLYRGGALIVGLLLLIFAGALLYSIYRGLDIHCGCFSTGSLEKGNLYLDLLRDLVLLVIAGMTMYRAGRTKHFNRFGEQAITRSNPKSNG